MQVRILSGAPIKVDSLRIVCIIGGMKTTKFVFHDTQSRSFAAEQLQEVGLLNESTEWKGRDENYSEWYTLTLFEW